MLDLAKRRAELEDRLAELDTKLHGIEEELDSHMNRDWEELAVEREGDEVLEMEGRAGQAEIASIRAALIRMDEGTYGDCVQCDEPIAPKRLELLPAAPLCAKCAGARKH